MGDQSKRARLQHLLELVQGQGKPSLLIDSMSIDVDNRNRDVHQMVLEGE